ncbi:hypothetical protein [Saccharopolyspora phatthalungensis]|uniref:Uncharacterized protein n=1 Tax=Saccharopolyspora phatthalungensis TaxID=664693 RepID=A0A840QDP9_9PSEU|nr:hypothetical protein [Saccharopolyspora phatthalungensis]MBB5158536.1 hypothetical protein [Saccharopolyspora phatthalungensis]
MLTRIKSQVLMFIAYLRGWLRAAKLAPKLAGLVFRNKIEGLAPKGLRRKLGTSRKTKARKQRLAQLRRDGLIAASGAAAAALGYSAYRVMRARSQKRAGVEALEEETPAAGEVLAEEATRPAGEDFPPEGAVPAARKAPRPKARRRG